MIIAKFCILLLTSLLTTPEIDQVVVVGNMNKSTFAVSDASFY